MDVNKVLIEKEHLIKNGINKVNIAKGFLESRCITIDDIYQEVLIKLWRLLEDFYDEKYDLDRFIEFQAAWNAKKILSNLKRSARCFTGSLSNNKKKGSQQSKIDDAKSSIFNIIGEKRSKILDEDRRDGDKMISRYEIPDSSYETLGEDIDIFYLIDEVNKRLELLSKSTYKDMFNFIIINQDLFTEANIYQILMEKFNYKTKDGIKNIIEKIREVVKDVVEEYNKS